LEKLLFITSNQNKIKEIKTIIGDRVDLVGLKDIDWNTEIPETTGTIKGNALQKADTVFDVVGMNCFSEDTGLEVFALDGAPGVDTAIYAGDHRSNQDNMDLLLKNLENKKDRSAQFKTVIALKYNDQTHYFEGIAKGHIADNQMGTKGFGYDPIFIPDNFSLSFAQLTPQEKNQISHRAKAVAQLIDFLKTV